MKINIENMKRYHSEPGYLTQRREKRKEKIADIKAKRKG